MLVQYGEPCYIDTYPEDATGCCRPGYVRVMCGQSSACLQIRQDIINLSQVWSTLASARALDNPSECIHMAHNLANADAVQIICGWLAKHMEFARCEEAAAIRVAFDRRFFLLNDAGHAAYDAAANDEAKADILDSRKDWLRWRPNDEEFERPGPVEERLHRTWEEIQRILFVSEFLELQPSEWHLNFKAQDEERLASLPYGTLHEAHAIVGIPVHSEYPESLTELCCHVLGDMILACESPRELEIRFGNVPLADPRAGYHDRCVRFFFSSQLCASHAEQCCAFCVSAGQCFIDVVTYYQDLLSLSLLVFETSYL